MAQKDTNTGHRQRLRERFLESGLAGFLDYEIVELLLTLGTPRKDCKKIAKDAIKLFGSLASVLESPLQDLQRIKGIGPANSVGILLISAVSAVYSKYKIEENEVLSSEEAVVNFLRQKIGNKKKEYFVILCFDSRNKLIFDDISIGTLNASLVHPREVFTKAIQNNSSHIIVAHNHPSGDCKPSEEDKLTTRRLVEAGRIIGITVVDHIIVAKNKHYGFKENGQI